ncbi:A-kinase anchor protein 4 [Microcaecilia unicolor]|uniref:A-kinase anchor protein 4 n=1 Tax=Microcaecilia unicolor TaxID=1415580 RepID=A0A6P7YKS9_9AMPH|nr:A-kinase anchor protein 4 [Microcaecilia unicolor]
MSHESNWLQSTQRLCSVNFINPTVSKDTGIRAVTFFDVSNWTEEDIHKSKGAADGAVFLMRPATDENLGLNSLFVDLEKYALGFRHVIDQVCYRFKWRSNATSRDPMTSMYLGNNSMFCNYANLPASKALLCILKHLMQISEKAELSSQDYCFLNVWDMIGLLSGLENFVDEVPIYATLLTSIVIYNVSQEIKAMRDSSKNAVPQLTPSSKQQEAADSSLNSNALEFATQMAKDVVDEGTFEASVKLMEDDSSESLNFSSEKEVQKIKTGSQQSMPNDHHPSEKVGGSDKQTAVSSTLFQAIEGTSQPDKLEKNFQSLSHPSTLKNQQESTSKGRKNYVHALMVEDISSPTIRENWMDQATEFKLSFAEYAYLLRLGLIEYIKQFASDLVDSILYSLVYGDAEEEEKCEDPILKSEFSKEEDLARFFLMLYANKLRGQIVRAMMLLSQRGQICNETPWKVITKAGEKTESSGTPNSPESPNVVNNQKVNADGSGHGTSQETPTHVQNSSVGPDSQAPLAEQQKQDSEALEQVPPDQAKTFPTPSPKLPPQASRKGDTMECIHKLMHYVVKDVLSKSDSKWCQAVAKEIEKNLPFPTCDPNLERSRANLSECSVSQPENASNQMVPAGVQELIDCLKDAGTVHTETGEYSCSLDTETRKGWSIKIIAAASAQETPEVLAINLNSSGKTNTQQLQALLQWAAASQLNIPLLHFREADAEVLSQLPLVMKKAVEKEIKVGSLLQVILRYWKDQLTPSQENVTPRPVLDWLLENL